jgi:hypothetical protein
MTGTTRDLREDVNVDQAEAQDWFDWHRPYDEPGSNLARRLAIVQRRIREALDEHASGPIRVVSVCAGQGRDLIGALAGHPRRGDVVARLVELDPRNAEVAVAAAREARLTGVEVVQGDASLSGAYDGAVPADLVLVCGVFGNIRDADIAGTVRLLPQLCAPGARVIWTRHRRPPVLTPALRRWFTEAGFEELSFDAPAGTTVSIGVNRLAGPPAALQPGRRMFTFVR